MKGFAILIMLLLIITGSIAINNRMERETENTEIIARIIDRGNATISTLQPIVVITSPEDGAVVTDSHLIVLGYADDENGMNYWEWEWHYEGGSYSNSSYFATAEHVEFRIDIYGLHDGWNLVIVRFKNIYGALGEDSVNVTYKPPDTQPPEVTINEPEDGQTYNDPNVMLRGVARDNVGITQFSYIHQWEGDSTGSSWPLEKPMKEYNFSVPITLHEGWNEIKVEVTDNASNVGYDEVNVTYTAKDTTPPTTTKVIGEPQYNEGLYVTSHTPFMLIAEDNGSGVNHTYYRIWYNDTWSKWMNYTDPFTLEGEGLHYVEFYSVDKEGNKEDAHNNTHIVDDTPPITYPLKNLGYAHWTVPHKWALICSPNDNGQYAFLADALYAYYTLKKHGYDDGHIILILCHNTQNNVYRDNNRINLLNGPDGVKGTADDPKIDYDLPLGGKFTMKDALIFGMLDIWLNMKDGDEALIYLCNHGCIDNTHTTYFCFEDGSKISEKEFASWVNLLFADFHKVVIVGDFCYSGCFLDTVDSCPANIISKIANVPPPKILISSTGNPPCKSHVCECCHAWFYPRYWRGGYAGLHFSHYFWNAIGAGRTYWNAFNFAINSIIAGQTVTVKAKQDPHYKSVGLGFMDNVTNSPLQPEYTDMAGVLAFYSEDKGGILYAGVNITTEENMEIWNGGKILGNPVGVKAIYYRMWHNEEWTPWMEFKENLTFDEEGKYYVEVYSEDYLGNREAVVNYTIYVDSTPPAAPTLLAPPDNGDTMATPTFRWSGIEDDAGVTYELQIATDVNFANIVYEKQEILTSNFAMKESETLSMGSYYWRVRAVDGVGNTGEWSDAWKFTVIKENSSPEKPPKPYGPGVSKLNVSYTFSTKSYDIDGDKIQYIFDWGDGTYNITCWHTPNETVTASHAWSEKGVYKIRVKAIDIHGAESEWSDSKIVVAPYGIDINIENGLYLFGKKIIPLHHLLLIGPIEIKVNAEGADRVEFYIDGKLKHVDNMPPYSWTWNEFAIGWHEIKVVAYFDRYAAVSHRTAWILSL